MTLIKNENRVLPLAKALKKLLVVGDFALKPNLGNGGSSSLEPNYMVSPMEGLKNYLGSSVEIIHVGDRDIEKAREHASQVDAVLIFAGSGVERHKKLLKGFEKVLVKAGETQAVQVDVMLSDLEYYLPEQEAFVFEQMDYQLYVGNSAEESTLVKIEAKLV